MTKIVFYVTTQAELEAVSNMFNSLEPRISYVDIFGSDSRHTLPAWVGVDNEHNESIEWNYFTAFQSTANSGYSSAQEVFDAYFNDYEVLDAQKLINSPDAYAEYLI